MFFQFFVRIQVDVQNLSSALISVARIMIIVAIEIFNRILNQFISEPVCTLICSGKLGKEDDFHTHFFDNLYRIPQLLYAAESGIRVVGRVALILTPSAQPTS